jgi:hypothetical protein
VFTYPTIALETPSQKVHVRGFLFCEVSEKFSVHILQCLLPTEQIKNLASDVRYIHSKWRNWLGEEGSIQSQYPLRGKLQKNSRQFKAFK